MLPKCAISSHKAKTSKFKINKSIIMDGVWNSKPLIKYSGSMKSQSKSELIVRIVEIIKVPKMGYLVQIGVGLHLSTKHH